MNKANIRYSEAFKLRVVQEMEEGKFLSQTEAARHYGISGSTTVRKWLIKYGKNHLVAKVIRVESPDEKSRLKELEEEIKRLKETVVDLSCREVYSRAALSVICEEYGLDEDSVKKKHAVKLSEKLPKSVRKKK